MRRARWGGLDCVVVGEGNGAVVVLLHGFGAPGTDLVALASALRVPEGTRFVFPAAPNDLSSMFGMGDSRAWWMIDMVALELARRAGQTRLLRAENPPGLGEARAQMIEMLDELTAELAPTSLVLGGFSQGAMLSMDVALHTSHRVAGLVLLSGALLAENVWRPLFSNRPPLRVFQSHGTADPVLPFEGAEDLRDLLIESGWEVEFVAFGGQHEIPPGVLVRASAFIAKILANDV